MVSERKQRKLLFYAFLVVSIVSVVLLIFYKQKLIAKNKLNQQQQEINEERVKSLIKEQELNLIKTSLDVQNIERRRIAQDLHDSIGGNLAAINLKLGSTVALSKELEQIKQQVGETYKLVRKISHNLIPDNFYGNRFTDVLEEYMAAMVSANQMKMTFNVFPKEKIDTINEKISVEIFRIVQELLTNTLKHASATKVSLQIDLLNDILHIIYEDNGVGFDKGIKQEGIGLQSIRDRLAKLKGTLHIDAMRGRGTILDIEVPVV
ncbi:sensor histidine kinase [Aquimarina sp. SS2-1]|uniref:sensor histidine kinase n=1 Tax=Aquimarina besae TaxID=3342247 RepID=UPI0036719F12